jgi:hypothetical protein
MPDEHLFDSQKTLSDIVERELGNLRTAYLAGVELALLDVLDLCRKERVAIPAWASEAIEKRLEQSFLIPGIGRGRARNPVSRYRQDLLHYMRYDAVITVQEYRQGIWADYQATLAHKDLSQEARKRLIRHAPHDPGKGWATVYAKAAEYLQNTPACGSPDTIRSSYRLVTRAMKDEEQHGRFYMLTIATRRRFQID